MLADKSLTPTFSPRQDSPRRTIFGSHTKLSWAVPTSSVTLSSGEVHIWSSALDLETSIVLRLQQTLAADEQARADRFKFRRDREHFIARRGLLRMILGRYLNAQPSELRFDCGPHGKPALATEYPDAALSFNMSHSDGLALYVVTQVYRVGVDVERFRSHLADEQIAERFFSPGEWRTLCSLPREQQAGAFFACWTRKEAYIKALGQGLAFPLDQFEVSLAPGEPAALLSTAGAPEQGLRWSLRELLPAQGYVAAVAVEGHDYRLRCWQWPDLFA